MPTAVRRRRPTLEQVAADLEHRTELECIRLDRLAGVTPPGMRRALHDHELDARVNFAELERTVDARARSIADKLAQDRARFAELLRADLQAAIDAAPGLAADQVVAGRLANLLDPTRYADPIAGTTELVAEAERTHSAELAHSVREGMARAVSEARAQGIPAGHVPGLPAAAQGKLDTLARRLAAQPHADVLTAARNAADHVAGTGLDAAATLENVSSTVDNLAPSGLDRYARPAAQASHNLGHQEAAGAAPRAVTIYASELLDRNTCGPCSLIDGTEYASEEEALADYPGGTYIDCEGGDLCRGTLVYVWGDEAPPTGETPGDEPAPPTPPAPYPLGTSRPLPPPPAPVHALPVLPDVLPPLTPPAPVELPVDETPPAPPTPPAPVLDDTPELELPEEALEAPYTAEDLAAARRDVPRARAEIREFAKAQRTEVLAQLERADALKLQAPPEAKAVRGPNGAIEYRREGQGWDWFDALHPDEQKRLRRDGYWMAPDGISPDELAAQWSARFGREVTTEEAALEWLDFTRQADALSTLSRGRLINLRPYGELDVNTLVDSPYDLRVLFGDKEEAAAHLAGVTADLEGAAVEDLFPAVTVHGPQGYEMTADDFVAEVRDLEARQEAIVPLREDEFQTVYRPEDQRVLDRLDELIPRGVDDDATMPLAELHDALRKLARRAGRL